MHVYEVCPRKDHRGFDLISDALPFDRLWYDGRNATSKHIGYAMHFSRSADPVIRVYDDAGNVIDTHEHAHALRVASAVVSPGLVTALCCYRAGKFPGHRGAAVSR
jgi:hypothetical protein